jgi:hypothetical protein
MDKSQWHKIGEEMADVLTKVAKKYGVTFESSGFTYGEHSCVFKTTATVNDASGQKKDLERDTFITWAKKYPSIYNPNWLDKTFTDKDHTYTVVGLKPGAKKYPIITRRDDDQIYNWSLSLVKGKFTPVALAQ